MLALAEIVLPPIARDSMLITGVLIAIVGALYLAYDLLHYASHAGALRGRVPRFLRQHHLTHHYRMPETRFGVSSPFWDRVFGTLR